MEKRGSGLRKICNETAKLPGFTEEKEPRFRSQANSFYTELPNNNYQRQEDDSVNINEPVKLNLFQRDLLDSISQNNQITRPELSERLNVSLTTIRRTIFQLKELGLLERVGSDKTGHWVVNNKKEY